MIAIIFIMGIQQSRTMVLISKHGTTISEVYSGKVLIAVARERK